ncbi:MAG: hypothetical protein GQ574_04055 [Crocinitomix sp.]|nr:hypothetical protein [Crocinitomix sp.]
MIRKNDFRKIDIEVKNVVKKAFEYAKKNEKNLNDYILFLANGHLMIDLVGSKYSPYTIDYRLDEMNDELRLNVLLDYIQHSYSFTAENSQDSKLSLSLELMIYTHMWESKPYLKTLKKLSDICDSQEYDWDVKVPDMSKHNFIRDVIRAKFKKNNLKIHEVITEGFHTSLRNAFAHSEYVLNLNEPKIDLLNFKNNDWELRDISFDDWTRRFCYSFLLAYHIEKTLQTEREKLYHGLPGYEIKSKNSAGEDINTKIFYDSIKNSFHYNP